MDEKIIVGSFNVRVPGDREPNDWAGRKVRIYQDLNRLQYDIFGAQEAVAEQIADLETAGYEHLGHGRNSDLSGEGTPIFFRAVRFEPLEDRTFWLSETPDVFSINYGSSLPRIATIVRFRDRKTGRELVFSNVHLAHRPNEIECRKKQISVLLTELEKYQLAGLPVILTGDFNAHPDEPVYRLTAERFRDSAKISQTPAVRLEGRTIHNYRKVRLENERDLPIDYIFVSEGITVLDYESFNNFNENGLASSDHYPQKAVIRL